MSGMLLWAKRNLQVVLENFTEIRVERVWYGIDIFTWLRSWKITSRLVKVNLGF